MIMEENSLDRHVPFLRMAFNTVIAASLTKKNGCEES
jgi:hypothetical protein